MDRSGQQLRYSNGIRPSVVREGKIGYCELYRSKSACLCMTIKDKKDEFGAIPKCNGMCAKQNINIYIENYEATTNNEKYDMKGDSTILGSYPCYKAVKSEGKMGTINNLYIGRNLPKTKSIYSEALWGESANNTDKASNWESTKSSSNVTFYPYLNNSRQYISEQSSCVKNQIETMASINHVQVNISSGVENSLLYNEINKNYNCGGNTLKDKKAFNTVPEQNTSFIASGTLPASTCSNLYVAPPYFTVDKFVNQEQADIWQNSQNRQFCSQNFYNQIMPSPLNFECKSSVDESVQTGENLLISNRQKQIGIKLLEGPSIPLMGFQEEPISLDIRKHHRQLPIKKEDFNYEKDCIPAKVENNHREKNIHVNVAYPSNPNIQNEFIQNTNNPLSFSIEQYNGIDPIKPENQNLYGIAEFRTTYNTPVSNPKNIAFHDLQYTQYQRNSMHETFAKKTCFNMLPSTTKNVARDVRKPNYRELINHVHALRSATSEDDLNMQIIKRTLNYNQQPKEVPSPIISRRLSTKAFRRNDDIKFSRNQDSNTFDEYQGLRTGSINYASPLDLSVKTIKTQADSTENKSKSKVLLTRNGYPPKFNFRPDFSENRNFKSFAGSIINTLDIKHKSPLNLDETVINIPSHFNGHCTPMDNDSNSNKTAILCRLENEYILPTSVPKMCSSRNCTSPENMQAYGKQGSEQGADKKIKVNLKRKIPLHNDDGNGLLSKQVCVETVYHSAFNDSSFNKYCEGLSTDFKTTSNIDPSNSVLNENVRKPSTDENKKDVQNSIIITQSEVLANNEELRNNFIETKQDVSSTIAARIRTKAELKGFTFQEDKDNYREKPFSNKENCHCNYDTTSVQMVEVDLSDWDNACNNFVDQLKNDCKNLHPEVKNLKIYEDKSSFLALRKAQSFDRKKDAFIDVHKLNSFEQKHSSEESNMHMDKFKEVFVKAVDNSLPLKKPPSSEFTFPSRKEKTDVRENEFEGNKNDPIKCEDRSNESNVHSDENIPKHTSKNINNIGVVQNGMLKNKNCRANQFATKSKNKEPKLLGSNSRTINLTKISVVRLKREKYASKRYTACDKNIKFKQNKGENIHEQIINTKEDSLKRHMYNVGRGFPSITKSALRRKNMSVECGRRRQQNVNSSMENSESAINTIATRLRHQSLQVQSKPEAIKRNNEINKSKNKKNKVRRFKNPNECELSNDPDKLYLEVYRYKRALKIPPKLITIRNPSTQRMSASLPDLDIDLHNNLLKTDTLHINTDHKVENAPKSIIDVLHSRVVKSKCQVKNIQKQSKNEHQLTPKSTMQRCNNSKFNFDTLNLYDSSNHSYREHRNVFETQVLTSRTRMEYKMQLNKEVIREIFGGSDRPASAPPEINNIKSDIHLSFEDRYNECFQQCIEKNKTNCEHDTDFRTCIHENLDDLSFIINSNSKPQTNDSNPSIISNKCKRKRNGRPYRRKFSSGFDYLRKRKKSNAQALYNYSHLKTRVENYLTETNLKLKSEHDVSKEIQRWVLNKGVGQSALHKAARLGYIDVIVYCLEKMALNPDHKDNAGYTPLHDACVNGSLEIARVLLQYGANHSEGARSGIRPLHEACENGHIEIVRMLLSYGADPLLETYSGQTPLMLASDPEMNDFIQMHLLDVQVREISKKTWRFPGPWKIFDDTENGYDALDNVSSLESIYHLNGKISFTNKNYMCGSVQYFEDKKTEFVSDGNGKLLNNQKQSLKNDVCQYEIFVDATDAEGELFEFEESNMPLPPLYLLKDEGMDKWVLLSDLCSLLKVKSKDTLLNKIFPSISPATISRAFIRELKMCDFLEKATCLQLLCAGEKINICHSKVVLIQYNENVRKLLGVKTIFMKF